MGYGRLIRLCLAIGAAGLLFGVAVTALGGGPPAGLSGGGPVTAPQAPPAPTPPPSAAPQVLLPVDLPTPPPTPTPAPTKHQRRGPAPTVETGGDG